MKIIVLILAITTALSACAEAPVTEFDPSNEYGDGIGRNFHRWRGKDYGIPASRGDAHSTIEFRHRQLDPERWQLNGGVKTCYAFLSPPIVDAR